MGSIEIGNRSSSSEWETVDSLKDSFIHSFIHWQISFIVSQPLWSRPWGVYTSERKDKKKKKKKKIPALMELRFWMWEAP